MDKEQVIQALEDFMKVKKGGFYPYLSGYSHSSWTSEPDLKKAKALISEEWAIGGMTGGNCWGDAHSSVTREDPKDIILLDEFLEQYMPNITLLQYKRLTRLIKYQDWTSSEYYGNSTQYKCAYITFNDIAECLSTMNNGSK